MMNAAHPASCLSLRSVVVSATAPPWENLSGLDTRFRV